MEHNLTELQIREYEAYLRREEHPESTVQKYLHDLTAFARWLDGRPVTRELTAAWKDTLYRQGMSPTTINGCLAALHRFFHFAGWQECRVKYLRIQRKMFRESSRDLTRTEFARLVAAAQGRGNRRLSLLLETICGTGVRVSEVKYITVEAAKRGRADISLKGKVRTILIPGKLAKKLLEYAKKQKIARGEIFLTASGKGLSRGQIWSEMKRLCKAAGVDRTKVFPHNLRHLFARTFYRACRDIVRLADVLGHSSIETTRIYLITTGKEYEKQLDLLGLVL